MCCPRVFEIFEFFKICVGGSTFFARIWIENQISIRNICIYWYFINHNHWNKNCSKNELFGITLECMGNFSWISRGACTNKRSWRTKENFWWKTIFKGTLPALLFQDILSTKIAYAYTYAPQNFCVGFIFDDEQNCHKKISKFDNFQ